MTQLPDWWPVAALPHNHPMFLKLNRLTGAEVYPAVFILLLR